MINTGSPPIPVGSETRATADKICQRGAAREREGDARLIGARGFGGSHTRRGSRAMPRGVKKENLPTKDCEVCGRPFTWRKKVKPTKKRVASRRFELSD